MINATALTSLRLILHHSHRNQQSLRPTTSLSMGLITTPIVVRVGVPLALLSGLLWIQPLCRRGCQDTQGTRDCSRRSLGLQPSSPFNTRSLLFLNSPPPGLRGFPIAVLGLLDKSQAFLLLHRTTKVPKTRPGSSRPVLWNFRRLERRGLATRVTNPCSTMLLN